MKKGDRVAYTVKYIFGDHSEYGTVTSTGAGLWSRPKVRIRVENPQPMRTRYVERYAEDVRLVPGKEKPADGRQKLTYEYLASLAVMPDPEHEDVNDGDVHDRDGAYGNSPLGAEVGLHIHAEADRWYETEPERPVHFIVGHNKIAAVYPDGVVNSLRSSWGDDWRLQITHYYPDRVAWLDRLLQDNPEITMDQVLARRGQQL